MINSSYEWLRYDKAKTYITMIDGLIASLQKIQKLPKDINQCEKHILTRQIEMLISAEREEPQAESLFLALDETTKAYHYDYERTFFKLRYAESLYFRDTTRALGMVEECRNHLLSLCGPEEKFYLWAKMDCAFLRFILKDPDADLNEMRKAHNALKRISSTITESGCLRLRACITQADLSRAVIIFFFRTQLRCANCAQGRKRFIQKSQHYVTRFPGHYPCGKGAPES